MTEIGDVPTPSAQGPVTDPEREWARKQIQKRRNLQGGFVAYVVVNAFLVGIWLFNGRGYFWPGWVLGGWGIGMVMGVWDYLRGGVSEADVDRELARRRPGPQPQA